MRSWLYRAIGMRLLAFANMLLERASQRPPIASTEQASAWVKEERGGVVLRRRGPPEDWLRRVRKGAPQLLEGTTVPPAAPPDLPPEAEPHRPHPSKATVQAPAGGPVAESADAPRFEELQVSSPVTSHRVEPVEVRPSPRPRAAREQAQAAMAFDHRPGPRIEPETQHAMKLTQAGGSAGGETTTRVQARQRTGHAVEAQDKPRPRAGAWRARDADTYTEKQTRSPADSRTISVPHAPVRRRVIDPGLSVTVVPAFRKGSLDAPSSRPAAGPARSDERLRRREPETSGDSLEMRWPDLPPPDPAPNEPRALVASDLRRQVLLDAEQRRR